MFDRIFSAALAFCMLAGGTLAVGTAMLEQPRHGQQIVHLQPVQVIGKRADLKLAQAEVEAGARVQ